MSKEKGSDFVETVKEVFIPGYKSAKETKQKSPRAIEAASQNESSSNDHSAGTDHGPLVKELWDADDIK
jgi:hypothetical protein